MYMYTICPTVIYVCVYWSSLRMRCAALCLSSRKLFLLYVYTFVKLLHTHRYTQIYTHNYRHSKCTNVKS